MNGVFLYGSTVLIWGSTWFAITFQLGEVAPEVSLVWRFGLAALILLAFCLVRAKPMAFSAAQHGRMALQGFFLFAVNYLVFYEATQHLTSGLVAVAFSTIVFWNILFGALLLGLKLRPLVALGGAIGLAGLCLVFWPEVAVFDLSSDGAFGLALAIGATILASLGNIASAANQRAGLPVVQTNAFGMAYGTFTLAVIALITGAEFTFEASFAYGVSLFYLALFGSVFGFGAYLTLIGRIGPDKAAYATVLFPLVALTLSTLFENYHWTWQAGLGVVLIIIGNVLALRREKPHLVQPIPPSVAGIKGCRS